MTSIEAAKLLHNKQREFVGAYGEGVPEVSNEEWEDLPESYRLFMVASIEAVLNALSEL